MDTTDTGQDVALMATGPAQLPRVRQVYTAGEWRTPQHAFPLPIGDTVIGRHLAPERGIGIPDNRVSRAHATLHVDPELRLTVSDAQSKNGTWVNGQRLDSAGTRALRDTDVVRVGDSLLVVRYEPISQQDAPLAGLLGVSPQMVKLRQQIARLAAESVNVLLQGETGTGKERAAHALHQSSGRSGALVAINCAALPEQLAESQLFGHVRGAFTGASGSIGFFRAADRGTLFLDEVGELSSSLQAKLLRALEESAVMPVGAVRTELCSVRVIAATNRNLESEMTSGQFREDLYARLSTITLSLPPLRARREDILLLLGHALGDAQLTLSVELAQQMLLYGWPRNVREVRQVADHLRLFGPDAVLSRRLSRAPAVAASALAPSSDTVHIKNNADEAARTALPRRRDVPLLTHDELCALLVKHHGTIRQVAAELACSRRQVGRMLEQHQLDPEKFRQR